ncbi:MAG: hypothetical protein ACRC0S_02750 [Fusobacteriaceae bacterium]
MEINKASIESYIDGYGLIECLKGFAELLDKRSYFSIEKYEIKRKKMNLALPVAAFLSENKDLTILAIEQSINSKERQIIPKMNRMSNLILEKLEENLFKLLVKNNFEFSLKYGKELFLRDRNLFKSVISKYVLLDNIDSLKSLMILSFFKLESKDDEFIFLLISYLTKYRADYSQYENLDENEENLKVEDIFKKIKEKKSDLYSRKGLAILSYFNLILESEEINPKCLIILSNNIEKLSSNKNSCDGVESLLIENLVCFFIKKLEI